MPRPRRISDAQIDAAAREVFVEHGLGAPVAEVAARLGVSHSALLQRAGSKEELARRALRPELPPALADLEAAPPPSGAARRLVGILHDLLHFLHETVPRVLALRAGGLSFERALGGREPPTLQLRRLLAIWLRRAGAGDRRRCRLVAEVLLGTIEARAFNACVGGAPFVKGDDRRLLNELVAELVPELRPRVGRAARGAPRRR